MNSTDTTPPNVMMLFDHKLKLVEQIVLASIFISALIGNTIVLLLILCRRRRHISRVAFFILHLTIADLLVAFFSILPMLIWKTTGTFFGGDILCRIVSFLMLAVSYISVYTLIAMANDRYQAIVHPLTSYTWSTRSGLIHMMGVWCLSLLLASPQLVIFRLAYHPAYNKKTCIANFPGPNRTWELIYIAWTIILQFLLPICILIFCYTSVYIIVNQNISMYRTSDNTKVPSMPNPSLPRLTKDFLGTRTSAPILDVPSTKKALNNYLNIRYSSPESTNITCLNQSSSHHIRDTTYPVVFRLRRSSMNSVDNLSATSFDGNNFQQRHGANHSLTRARLKTIKLTFVVVLTYMLCSTPFYIGSIIMTLNGKFMSQKTMNWLMTIFSLLFNLNSCSNPIVCLILSGSLLRCKKHTTQPPTPSQKTQTNIHTKKYPSKVSL